MIPGDRRGHQTRIVPLRRQTPAEQLPAALEPIVDVQELLWFLARRLCWACGRTILTAGTGPVSRAGELVYRYTPKDDVDAGQLVAALNAVPAVQSASAKQPAARTAL